MMYKITNSTLLLGIAIIFTSVVSGQVINKGTLYIKQSGILHVKSNSVSFTGTAITRTDKTGTYGVMSFGNLANILGGSDSHFLNGYARTYSNNAFIAPVGDGMIYAPARIIPSTNAGVDITYLIGNPSLPANTLSNSIFKVSEIESWRITGTPSTIGLSWRASSDVELLPFVPSADYLTIVGRTLAGQWVEIPSAVDGTSFLGGASIMTSSGSISSTSVVDLSLYDAFTIGAKKELPCFPAIVSSGNTKTWNGSWSPSPPSLTDPVILNAPYIAATSGNFSCYSIEMNADITLGNSNTLEVATAFTGTGKVIMASEAVILQREGGSNDGPNIEIIKVTNPMRRFDYVFLSSPINNMSTFFGQVLNKDNAAVEGLFGDKPSSAFEQLRTFDAAGLVAINATVTNTPVGRGFSATVRNQLPYSTSFALQSWYEDKKIIHLKTEGKANNGDVPVTVPSAGWVRIGNPYPSPIDGARLLDAMGPTVRQTLYYWTYSTPRGTLAANSYNNASFATWNRSGGTQAAAGGALQIPNGNIATMQSVLAYGNAPGTTFNITNCMREIDGNNNFFKTVSVTDNGKFRLNLVGSEDSFSQILIAYDNQNGTLGADNGFDSRRLAGTSSEISSLINNERYTIQTRPQFELDDVVPLQFDKRTDETFTISLATTEGIFEGAPIYLHDKTLNIYHDLSTGSYSFIQAADGNNQRFDVVYQNITLDNGNFDINKAFAFINKFQFVAQANTTMKEITIYDIAGRLITTYSNINSQSFTSEFNRIQGVYIAKIQMVDGTIVNQKVVNQ